MTIFLNEGINRLDILKDQTSMNLEVEQKKLSKLKHIQKKTKNRAQWPVGPCLEESLVIGILDRERRQNMAGKNLRK